MTDAEVAKTWAQCMNELRDRDLIRTANTPVGDYAERICCERLGLHRKGFSAKSIDAIGSDGTTYQIKGRRLTPSNRSRQVSAIRDIHEAPFDVLLAVYFDEDLNLLEIWQIPHEVVAEAPFVARTNSTRFVLTRQVMADPRVERLL